ncbi:unnamed protein product [Cyclocybe aegerita]|uniref:PH domain-containing protein n=1 Tax=Cyclocybe aegerita TaxID=1973307 RepID=A0A8S0WHX4_CYCAE|nr:unnamed protein product [Cyclocybe aegerita]
MSSEPTEIWSPPEGTTTYTGTFSPSRYSYTSRESDIQRYSSDGDESEQHMRRVAVSPSPSQEYDDYNDDNSIDEVDATLNNLDEEIDNTEQAVSDWSGSYSPLGGRTFSSATGTFTYSGTYTGSPSFVSLPTFSPRSPPQHQVEPRFRLSRITERTEESRPSSASLSTSRPANPTPDNLRRSALLGVTPSHSRASTDPSSDRTLPAPGRLGELIAVFESPGHTRTSSTPGYRASSPMLTSAGYGYGTTSYGYGSRSSSPTKSASGSSGSNVGPSLLSPPERPTTTSGFRSTTSGTVTGTGTATGGYTSQTPSTYTNINTWTNRNTGTGSYTTPSMQSRTYTDTNTDTYTNTDTQTYTHRNTEDTFTRTSVTPSSGLRKPQTSPRSPLASVRNIVALWKERTPASGRSGDRSPLTSVSPPQDNDGLYGIRRRVEGARARLRESRQISNPLVTPTRPALEDVPDNASVRSGRSGVLPPGFDLNEFSNYAQSKEPPVHIGLLWYLNVHASPPYRWQRCQALLYPHMLLLSWLAPGGGRGIVALDLLNCTSVQSAPSPTHPSARDDVGTIAARQQMSERDALPLMDMLVPFHMLYADGVERLAAESLLERQKWVNRLWEAVNRPLVVPNSVSVTRSPTGSIRTILSINSSSSTSSNGSRSTVFVPPLSSLPDISDFQSTTSGLSRQSSIITSHHTRTVDDTVIQNQEYVYPGDPRVITPTRGRSLRRRSGSMTDLDDEFKMAISRARDAAGRFFGGSPVTISSGSSLGKNIFITPPPSVGRGGDRARSEASDEHFFSAGSSDGVRSNVSSTYFSQTSLTSTGRRRTMTGPTTATSPTQVSSSTFTSTYRPLTGSGSSRNGDSELSFADSPSTLSRAREIRRRVAGTSRSYSSGYQTEGSHSSSDKENDDARGGSRTPTGSYTPGSGSLSLSGRGSGSYTGSYSHSRSRTPTGSYSGSERSRSRSGSYSGTGSRTGSGGYTPSGSYTPGSLDSGSYTLQAATNGAESTSSSGIGGHTPISSSETGYDVCPSSDFTDLTRPTLTSESETAAPFSPPSPTISAAAPASEKYVTASQASTEYVTAVVQSSRTSITSFESFPTIPGSEYLSAESVSTEYRTASDPGVETDFLTASEPSEPSPPSEYVGFEDELEEIPSESQLNTPVLSSLDLDLDRGREEEERSIIRVPSAIPTIRSPSIFSELLPEEIPLPPSAPPSVPPPATLSLPSPSPSPSLPSLPVTQPPPTSPLLPSLSPSLSPTPTPSLRPSIPPSLPPSLPSSSPSLSLTPSPLAESTEERDVATPTSFQIPPTTESSVQEPELPIDQDEDAIDEETVSLSLLSSLPPSTLGSTSVITPTSLDISSASTASTLPPSTPVLPRTTSAYVSESSLSTSADLTTFTQTSSSLVPPSPQPWATATDISYESSILQPSPSIRSIALHESIETSFETSFLRPSGSPSSIGRMSTIPPSPSPLTSAPPQSPLQPLTPVPALPPSISSATDVETPTSLMFSSESSSSLGRTLSTYSSSSYVSQSSLSSSIFGSGSEIDWEEPQPPPELEPEPKPDVDLRSEPSTVPTLLSTPRPSHHSPSLTPSPVPTQRLLTPEGSLIVSITTPQGSGATEQSSLRTIPSVSTVITERDLAREMDRLVGELHTYDQARGLENEEIAENVRALREELRDLANFLQRTPPPSTAPIDPVPGRPVEERVRVGVQLVDRSIGGSSVVSSLRPSGLRVMEVTLPPAPATSLSRATSNASSQGSYLSSHHSDDFLFDEPRSPPISTGIFEAEDVEDDITTEISSSPPETSSSSVSSSPLSPSSELSSEASTVRQTAPDALERALRGIQAQLGDLERAQASARNLLEALQERQVPAPEDHTGELADRLQRIEELIQNLLEQGHPRGPEIVVPAPTATRTVSISESSDSLRRLRSILHELASPLEDGPHAPSPRTAQAGPSVAQQLDTILSSAHDPRPRPPPELPQVRPFIYRPTERGDRARSASPASIETVPPRPPTVPLVFVRPSERYRAREARVRPVEPSEPDTITQAATFRRPSHPPDISPEELLNEQRRQRDLLQQASQPQPQPPPRVQGRPVPPPPQPVLPTSLYDSRPPRVETAPPDFGDEPARGTRSWYQRPGQPRRAAVPSASGPSAPSPTAGPSRQPSGIRYMPMPSGPTFVQLPPLFDSLMEILRENRLAQLATVDQQRELMRYMRGLNEWLERDVHDRQSELRGVVARVDQLSDYIRDMQRHARAASTPSSTTESDTQVFYPPGPPGPSMPQPQPYGGYPAGFQPFDRPVVPSVVPDITPRPAFGPVIPQAPQPTIIVQPGGVIPPTAGVAPAIPMDGYHTGGPGPQPVLRVPTEPPIFIPPGFSPSGSTGTPRPAIPIPTPTPMYSTMGPNVVHVPPSPESSTTSSTRRTRSPRRRPSTGTGRSRRYGSPTYSSRSRSRRRRSRSRSRSRSPSPPLMVTNGSPRIPMQAYPPSRPASAMYPPTPTVHVVPPSAPSMAPHSMYDGVPQQQQPTIIIQQPSQPAAQQPGIQQPPVIIQQPPPVVQQPPTFMPPMETVPSMTPMPMSPLGIPPSGMPMTGVPMTGVPMQGMPMGVPMTGMPMGVPMTGMPMGVPMTGMPMGVPMTGAPPVIVQQGSPRSSRSRSSGRRRRSRERRTPPPAAAPAPAPAPVIITGTERRSRSRSPRRHTPPPAQMPAGLTILPSQPLGPGAQGPVMMMPARSPSRRSHRSRRRSHSPDRVMVQPQLPTIYAPPVSQAAPAQPQVLVPGTAMAPMPVVLPHSPRRSRSRSRERRDAPIILPGAIQQPLSRRSPSPHRRYYTSSRSPPHRRRYTRSPSPRRRRSRTPSSPRRRRTRSPSPRRHRSRSRTPTRAHYPSTTPVAVIPPPPIGMMPSHPGYYPTHRSTRSPSPRRRSPTRVQVVGDPGDRRRSYSPHRSPSRARHAVISPRRRRYYSPRDEYRGRPYSPRDGYRSRAYSPRDDSRGRPYYSPRGRSYRRSYSPRSLDSRDRYRTERGYPSGRPRSYTPSPRRPIPGVRRARTLSPTSSIYSPRRSRYQDRPRSPRRTGRTASPRPISRQATGVAPTAESGPRDEIRIVVPSRGAEHRPPTIFSAAGSDAGRAYPSRPVTPHRVASQVYSPRGSTYHSPPPAVHVRPPSIRSERSPPPGPSRVPSILAEVPRAEAPRAEAPRAETGRPPLSRPPTAQPPEQIARPPIVPGERAATPQPPPRLTTPFDFRVADENREQLDALNEAANRLQLISAAAEESEDQRELEFRHHEDHREQVFLEHEERRNQEARDRAAGIWNELESRLAALPAPAPPVQPEEEAPITEAEAAAQKEGDKESIASIRTLATQAATQHAAELMETIRLEREDAAREREEMAAERAQLLAELRAEKDRVIEEKDNRIKALEDELSQLRSEFEAERQQRETQESEMREREREERMERDEFVRAQLGDITNLVQDQRDMCETKKQLMDARWEEKQVRRQDKEAQMIELRDMVQKIHEDMETDRNRADDERRQSREAMERIIDDLQTQNAQQRELLTQLSESWRADCEKHHEETLNAVRSTANEQVPFNVQGYLDEFSRALATEVRMLLGEVGKIREERRALQHEIGDLLCMRSKYGPGGEYEPDWKPPPPPAPPPEAMAPSLPDPPAAAFVPPAWRKVPPPREKKKKTKKSQQAAASTSAPPPAMPMAQQYDDARHQLTSWATWMPNRDNLTPLSVEPTIVPVERRPSGLFGPASSNGSMYEQPR